MSEFFLGEGRNENWSVPPVEGEILFRVSPRSQLYEPEVPPYIWTLFSVEEIDKETGRMELKEMARALSLSKQGELLVDIHKLDKYLEVMASFGGGEARKKYFRTTEFEVNRFLYGVPRFLKLNQRSLNINPRVVFGDWKEEVVSNSRLLPENRDLIQRVCRRIERNGF